MSTPLMSKKEDKNLVAQFKNQIAASRRFVKMCEKPKKDEWKKLTLATSAGMVAIGFAGYVIKALSYPLFTKLGGMTNIIEE